MSGSGPVDSWAGVARRTFACAGHDPNRVGGVSTAEYFSDATYPVAPRPANSVLDLARIESAGFVAADADEMLTDYIRREIGNASGATVR